MTFINLVEMVCPECGKVFYPAALHIYKDGNKVFCKWSCYNSYINKKEQLKETVKEMKRETKFKFIRVKLDDGAKMPTRAHSLDAGYDIYARETQIVEARGSAKFDTGVHIEIPTGYVGMLKSKSGLNVHHSITSEGVIDSGYTGSIVAKLYNNSGYDYKVNAGDKITQLVIMPIITPELLEVDELGDTDRGNGGFGSTGK